MLFPSLSFSQDRLEDLVQRSKIYENMVYSGEADFIINGDSYYVGSSDSVLSSTYSTVSCTFTNNKYFSKNETVFDNELIKKTSIYTTLFTPEKWEVFTLSENDNGLYTSKALVLPVEQNRRKEDCALSYGMSINGIKISEFLSGRYINDSNPVKTIQLLRKELLNEVQCFVVQMEFEQGDLIITAWLSDEHQLKPIQIIENYPLTETEAYAIIRYEYTLNNDIWCTKKMTAQSFQNDVLVSKRTVDFIKFDVNIPIDDDIFLWTMPSGVQAYDQRVDKYIDIP